MLSIACFHTDDKFYRSGDRRMKLLIADDEELTREGLMYSIDWNSLGIREIFQADDGKRALEIAKAERPDIILSDIRMPRMTGIQMIEELEKFSPDTSVIFMSGYSDKEYLKAAIKLKAVTYVEKPLNSDEIREAVLDAKENRLKKLRSRRNEDAYTLESSFRLGNLLTRPYLENAEEIQTLLREHDLPLTGHTTFTTFIIKLKNPSLAFDSISRIRKDLKQFVSNFHMNSFYTNMHFMYHVFHLMSETRPSGLTISQISDRLQQLFSPFGDSFISQGETAAGIQNAYRSYTDAVVLIQHSYFFQAGALLNAGQISMYKHMYNRMNTQSGAQDPLPAFSAALLDNDPDACFAVLDEISGVFDKNTALLPTIAKDMYYRLFMQLEECSAKLKLPAESVSPSLDSSILEHIETSFTYHELHRLLTERTEQFFRSLASGAAEDSTIFLIKNYISKHYSNEALSIKEISDHVFLSTSYVCTYFKSQTGKTLNQYLTEYRMEKAIRLLADPRYQIADISSKVGYSNGNYFGKSFKKYTGVSPTKYREDILG